MSNTRFGVEFELFGPKKYSAEMANGLILYAARSSGLKIRSNYEFDSSDDYCGDEIDADCYETYTRTGRKKTNPNWHMTYDGSLYERAGQGEGLEMVSPILRGKDGYQQIVKMLSILNKVNCTVNQTSGLHVHVGNSHLNNLEYFSVLYRYNLFEHQIEKYFSTHRRGDTEYAKRMSANALALYFDMTMLNPKSKKRNEDIGTGKYAKVGIHECFPTFEFRQHEGCLERKKVLTWVNFCVNFADQSKHILGDINPKKIKNMNDLRDILVKYPPEFGLSPYKANLFKHFQNKRSKQ